MLEIFSAFKALSGGEAIALWGVFGPAIAGLFYAGFLMMQVLREDQGTAEMQKISGAIREGANAYLNRPFKTIAFLIFLLFAMLYFTAGENTSASGGLAPFSWDRSFLLLWAGRA